MKTTWSNHLKRLGLRWQSAATTPLLVGREFLPKRCGASLPAAVQNVVAIVVCALVMTGTGVYAATNDLSGLLQRGLFEEEANRNLDAASAAYETLVRQFDKDRQIGATAIFRLGEVYRKQGKTNEAAAQYERIVRDFAEQTTLVTLSRQNLAGLGVQSATSAVLPLWRMDEAILSQAIAIAEAGIIEIKKEVASGRATPLDQLKKEQELTQLRKELERLQIKASLPETGGPSDSFRHLDLAQLKKLSQDELLQVLLTLAPDPLLDKLLEQQNSNAAKLAELSQDHGPMSPDIQRLKAVQEVLAKQIDDRAAGILRALELRQKAALRSESIAKVDEALPRAGAVATVANEEEAEIRRLQTLIQNSPDLINGAPEGESPLYKAAGAGWLQVAKFLLDNGANVNKVSVGRAPLHNAVQFGHKAMVELLLQRGTNVEAKDGTGGTALHLAAQSGFLSIAEVLVKHKADLHARNNQNNGEKTPLHLAVAGGHRVMSELLIERGADVNAVDANGSPPIIEAALRGHSDLLARLLALGSKPDVVNAEGFTALSIAAAWGKSEAVTVLLAAKADPNLETKSGRTALSFAMERGYEQIVQLLLDAGAKPNLGKLDLPLLVAAGSGRHRIAELLLSRGADANQESASSEDIRPTLSRLSSPATKASFGPYVPLQVAVARKDVEMVSLLLKGKADPNTKQHPTWSTPVAPLLFSVLDNEAMLRAFLEAGANANARSGHDLPAVITAAQIGNRAAMELLLKHGAEVNVAEREMTALHWAASQGHTEIARVLIAHRADLNATNVSPYTPLNRSVRAGHKEIVALLLEHGANPNLRDGGGLTPLDYTKPGSSARSNSKQTDEAWAELAELLRKNGALEDLPDFTRIRITRPGLTAPLIVFPKAAKATNQFTLLETVMWFYQYNEVETVSGTKTPRLPFPDFGRIIIHRPSPQSGGKAQEIKVNLLNGRGELDCANDVPVMFGDVIEIPERVHALNETAKNPVREMEDNFAKAAQRTDQIKELRERNILPNHPTLAFVIQQKEEIDAVIAVKSCLRKSVQLVVASNATPLVVDSWKEGFLNQALAKVEARAALRSSSDLTRVKVTRQDATAGKSVVLTVDATDQNDGFWLQDGDVIEVSDKR